MASDGLAIVEHLGALRRYAMVLTRDTSAADDLVQATFLRAHERRASFKDGGDVRVWLMCIMHNRFIDERRSAAASAARERAFAEAHPDYVAPAGEPAARLAQLRHAFLQLPAEQREALHLCAIEGLGVAHAATVLGVAPGTVMSRVARARAALRAFEAEAPHQNGRAEGRPQRGRPGGPTGRGGGAGLRVVGGRDDGRD